MPILKRYCNLIVVLLLVIVLILLLIIFTDMHVAKIDREIRQVSITQAEKSNQQPSY